MLQSQQNLLNVTRRHFFRECGVGKVALASLLCDSTLSDPAREELGDLLAQLREQEIGQDSMN